MVKSNEVFKKRPTSRTWCVGFISRRPMENCDRWGSLSTKVTALFDRTLSESATITHPYHPLRGQRFQILKSRVLSGTEVLSLRSPSGQTLTVNREWTDRSDPSTLLLSKGEVPYLHLSCLVALANLVKESSSNLSSKKSDKILKKRN